jgi:hypothetical protein
MFLAGRHRTMSRGRAALGLDRSAVRRHAMKFSWASATAQFLANLRPASSDPGVARAA